MTNKFTERLFQDKTGEYVVGQAPNIPVYMILFSFLAKTLLPMGGLQNLAAFTLSSSIFLWAYLEIVYGESVFRRLLGAAGMIGLLVSI